jgi:hypothetical protein
MQISSECISDLDGDGDKNEARAVREGVGRVGDLAWAI